MDPKYSYNLFASTMKRENVHDKYTKQINTYNFRYSEKKINKKKILG